MTGGKQYAQELMDRALSLGCGAAEVCAAEREEFGVGVLGGDVEDYSVSSTFALGLRVQLEGRDGYAYTEAAEDAEGLVREAMDGAQAVQDRDEHPMGGPARYPDVPPKPDALSGMDERRRIELCRALERAALNGDSRIKRTAVCRVATARGRFGIYNTLGLAAQRLDAVSCCYVEPIAEADGESRDGFAFRVDGEAADIESCAAEAVEEALSQLGASPVPSGRYDVILRADAAAGLIGAFAGMFSGDAAQKGLSLLAGREGEIIAADCVDLADDPLYPANPSPFDDEGTPSVKTSVIEKGRLVTLLHNLKTARKAGTVSTSNGGRGGPGSPVGVRPSNFFIVPGGLAPARLRAQLGNGLVITDFSGLHAGVNAVSGRFSLPCRGRLIRNGEDVRAVNGITVSGDFTGLLKSIGAVGSDLRFSMPGGSSVGSPSLLAGGMAVSGRG